MTTTSTLRGLLALPDGSVRAGTVRFSGRIEAVMPDSDEADADQYILPGFVDTHVHGGGGGDTMDGAQGIRTLSRLHARHGTTTLLPTTMTNPWANILAALHAVAEIQREGGVADGAQIVGAHLEGPFISPGRLGAQPPETLEPTPERVREVLDTGVVRAITIAPELPGALAAAQTLVRAGVRVGVGHTLADAGTVSAFVGAVRQWGGQGCATHLFNAMGGVQGREPGPPGALMADAHAVLEVILDNIHVHPISFRLACAAAPGRVMLVTDAMRAAGLGDGESELGGQRVTVRNGEARLPGGSLAGSVLTMDAALRNAVGAGVPLGAASQMTSRIPARSIGLLDRGQLAPGLRADLVVLDRALQVRGVYIGGQLLPA